MKRAYLDTSVWIARTEGIPAYRNLVRKEMQALMEKEWQLCLSDLVALETLIKPFRQNQPVLISIYNEAFLEAIRFPAFDSVFNNALFYAQSNGLKSLDAIHIAIAMKYDCDLFVTTDPDFRTLNSLPLHWIDLSQTALQ